MLPALVVGLGGTGSWALAHLKRRLLADSHWTQLAAGPAALTKPDYDRNPFRVELKALDVDKTKRPAVGTLRLDAAVEDIALSAPIGQAIESIKNSDGRSTSYPTIQAWLPIEEAREYQLGDAVKFMTEGAGQIRQFGRVAFFYDMITNARELSKLDAAFTRLAHGDNIQIFVVASVAGGTGGGLLIDTLAYLQAMRQRQPGQISVRTTAFITLPGAFSGVARGEEFARMQANGFGTLRELDRLMNAHETVKLEWQPGREIRLDAPAADACYLLDGSRDLNEGPQLDGHEPVEDGLPVAIADAIYAHVFPSSGGVLGRDYPNLSDALVGGTTSRYSSFGSYAITYAWEPLMRSFGLRALDDLIGAMLLEARDIGRAQIEPFLKAGATGTLAAGEKQQAVPPIASDALTTAFDPLTLVVPGAQWLSPRDQPAPVPAVPTLRDRFPGIGRMRTEYTNPDVVAQATDLIDQFWGARDGVWTGAGDAAFYPAVNYNAAAAGREWRRGLFIASAALMNANGKVGGVSAAHEFLVSLELRLEQFGDALSKIARPDLATLQAAVQEAEEEMNDGRTWDDPKEQRDWLNARQDLLEQQFADACLVRTNMLVGDLLRITGEVKQEVVGWREQLDLFRRTARERRIALDDERRTANDAPLERYFPQPGDPIEDDLYVEAFGTGDATTLPRGLTDALETLTWGLRELPERPTRIVLSHPAVRESDQLERITFADVESVALRPFVSLRTESLLGLLERAGTDADTLVDEIRVRGARLSAFNPDGQLSAGEAGIAENKDWNYVFAAWPAEGPGSRLAGQVRERLTVLGLAPAELGDLNQPGSLPTEDKILAFSARHLIALDAFSGVNVLERPYEERRDHRPSPHVLPEERGAALLEALSESLARDGLLSRPLDRLNADGVALCTDQEFLQYVAAAAAAGQIAYVRTDPVAGTGSWRLGREGDAQELGTERELGEVLAVLMSMEDRRGTDRRAAVQDAGAKAANGAGAKEMLLNFARDGWYGDGEVSGTANDLMRVASAQLAAKL